MDPSRPIRRERMPGALPHGMSVEALGLRSPPAMAMAARRAGFLSDALLATARGLVTYRGSAASAPPPARGPLPPSPRPPEAPADLEEAPVRTRRLRAVLRLVREGEIVLEVSVTGEPLAWAAPAEVTVRLHDGSVVGLRVDREKSTAPGSIAAPQSLRLVLRVPRPPVATIASIELLVGEEILFLDVRD